MGANNNGGENLPDIGSPASATISTSDEYRLGAQIVRQLRDEKAIMEDPEVTEYLQSLGQRLAAQAPDTNQRFTFFAVNEGTINAFALPGGFIGVNYGTVLASRNESELAGVVGHEVAHVTQRHMARTFHAQSSQGIAQTAAILAAILIGAMTGGSGMEGAIAIAQGAAAQQQVNFTRANEYEADRVGIGFVAGAGFDPNGMASFFEAMSRHEGLAGQYVPEMIQTPPGELEPYRRGARPRGSVRPSEEQSGFGDLRVHPRAAARAHHAEGSADRRAATRRTRRTSKARSGSVTATRSRSCRPARIRKRRRS